MENTTNTQTENVKLSTNKNNLSKYITPIAIVVAGILIAIALYIRGDATKISNKDLLQDALAEPKIEVAAISNTDHIRGDKDAKIVLIEYSDTECPFCKTYHGTMKKIYEEYSKDNKVAWVYRHFPMPYHQKAPKEAEAAECAAEIGGSDMFWKYIDEVYATTESNDTLDPVKLPEIAVKLGLDKTKFMTCLDSGKYATKIKESYEAGLKAGSKGTPYTVIGFEKDFIPLVDNTGLSMGAIPYELMKQIINKLLIQK